MIVYCILFGYDYELYFNKIFLCFGIFLFDKGCFLNSFNVCSFIIEWLLLIVKLSRVVEFLNKLKYVIYYFV